MTGGDQPAFETARHVAQTSYCKLVAYIAKQTHDVAGAEDALSEAFAAALQTWPRNGIPDKPEAWLLAVAKRKTIDNHRRKQGRDAGISHLQMLTDELDEMMSQEKAIPDERLALMFACAHPTIDDAVRSPLILQAILGMTAEQIAAAFLVAPATMGQRLSRAKAKIKLAGIPFRVPERAELPERLDAVLEAIYAAYATAWIDGDGSADLAVEAIWLARLMCQLLPDEPEALGLAALLLFLHSRRNARRGKSGEFVPLTAQDTANWEVGMIDEAEGLLRRAQQYGAIGRYQLEAAIQSVHAVRRLNGTTDWAAICQLYDGLFARFNSPVVAINRAVAIAEARGYSHGIAAFPDLAEFPELVEFQPFWAARAYLLAGLAQNDAARAAYDRAIELANDQGLCLFLQGKRDAVKSNVHYLPPNLRPAAQT